MTSTLRESILQGYLESGWTEENLKESLRKESLRVEEQRYLPSTPEFVGYFGKIYLQTVVRRLLPMRLYWTWVCLLADLVGRDDTLLNFPDLAKSVGGRPETIRRNIFTLQKRGLLTLQKDRQGALHFQNCAGLYALASEYHTWCESEDYIAPTASFVEIIKRDSLLVAKLRRFNSYQVLLYKGVKITEAEITRWYASTREVHHGE